MTDTILCPGCAAEVPETETVWLVRGRFYCSQECAKGAYDRE